MQQALTHVLRIDVAEAAATGTDAGVITAGNDASDESLAYRENLINSALSSLILS